MLHANPYTMYHPQIFSPTVTDHHQKPEGGEECLGAEHSGDRGSDPRDEGQAAGSQGEGAADHRVS